VSRTSPSSASRLQRPTEKTRRRLFALAKARAKRLGVPFLITLEEVQIPNRCPVLGVPLRVGPGMATYQSPSLDRLVAAMGYIPGNVAVISHRANTIKNNACVSEMESVVAYCRRRIIESMQ
jgi:hypothetical protein